MIDIKAKRLTQEQKQYISSLYDKYSCVEISKIVGVTTNQVYELKQKLGLSIKQNPTFVFNAIQNQILLSGKIGDGNYKQNGNIGCFYRESHAMNQYEYLSWKANSFGNKILSKRGIYEINTGYVGTYNKQRLFGFSTKTSSSFNYYKELCVCDVINNLDVMGLMLLLMDDGWLNIPSDSINFGSGHFCLSHGKLSIKEIELLCDRYINCGFTTAHILKNNDVSFCSSENNNLYEATTSFIPKDIDIIKTKFRNMLI